MSDGSIVVGSSEKSVMAASRIEDLRALLASESRLPTDLKEKARPVLEELKSTLAIEKDSKEWYRSIALILYRWESALSDVASSRTENRNPELKSIKEKDLTIEQSALYQKDVTEVQNQVLEAKYAIHPNWTSVERVFAQARTDLLAEIQDLKIPENQKQTLMERAGSVRLRLPYPDPNQPITRDSCASTEVNAFYNPSLHTFTVCAGFFNSYQSDSSLYGMIAHEISHAIDPTRIAARQYRNQSDLAKSTNRLSGSKGSAISCNEWEKLVNDAKKIEPLIPPRSFDSMQALYDCLQPKSSLEQYTASALQSAAERSTRSTMSNHATSNSFLTLSQPTVTKDGRLVGNEFYLRPDRLLAAHNNNNFQKEDGRDADILEIFTQALTCSPNENRVKSFNKAIEETKVVFQANMIEWYSFCGKNCSNLMSEGLSADSSENFADWLSIKALRRFIERKQNMRDRREAAALAAVDLCESPGPKADAPDLAAAEKQYSLENHPDTRIRRISVFNKIISGLVKCEINQQEEGFGQCDL